MFIVNGLIFTLEVTALSAVIGIALGIIIALFRMSNDFLSETRFHKLTRWNPLTRFAILYIDIIRGTPAMVQLMVVNNLIFVGSLRDTPKLVIAGIAFGINSGAYVSEIIRSGIQGLDKGQMEAARALGMPYKLTMSKIILPQAVKHTMPTLVSEFIILLKETSVVSFIGGADLLRAAETITSKTYNGSIPLLTVAVVYLILTSLFTYFMRGVERRARAND